MLWKMWPQRKNTVKKKNWKDERERERKKDQKVEYPCLCSCSLFCNPVNYIDHQAPPSMGFPSKNSGVGCHFLLQGVFQTQGSNSCLLHFLHWQVDSLPLSHLGSPGVSLLIPNSWFIFQRLSSHTPFLKSVRQLSVLMMCPFVIFKSIQVDFHYLQL